ncbi:MAG: type 1 glutamine amidotransferase [Actinomycetota bacterium]
MRIGLLISDHVRPEYHPVAGDYLDMFHRLFVPHPEIELDPFDLTQGELPDELDGHAGWIGTGSRYSAYDKIGWIERYADLVRRFDAERRRFVGICFSHQMIGHALGGRVQRAPNGWQAGIRDVEVSATEAWMEPPAARFRIIHSNQDQIVEPPAKARVLGTSPEVPVSVLAVDNYLLGLQGHPEFDPAYSAATMEGRRGRVIPEKVVEAGLASLSDPPDTALLGGWIARFLAGPPGWGNEPSADQVDT